MPSYNSYPEGTVYQINRNVVAIQELKADLDEASASILGVLGEPDEGKTIADLLRFEIAIPSDNKRFERTGVEVTGASSKVVLAGFVCPIDGAIKLTFEGKSNNGGTAKFSAYVDGVEVASSQESVQSGTYKTVTLSPVSVRRGAVVQAGVYLSGATCSIRNIQVFFDMSSAPIFV